jgi:hypothetical protein
MSCGKSGLLESHGHGRFIYYKLMTAIPVFAAVLAIMRHGDGWHWLVLYAGLCLTYAGIMYLFKCPHCHYYQTGDPKMHRCFFIYGTPRSIERARKPRPPVSSVSMA